MGRFLYAVLLIATFAPCSALAGKIPENLFASVYYKNDKIGQVHLTTLKNEKGEIEQLKATASISFLGLEVYGFNQNLQEDWVAGELQNMSGKTDDNGTAHEISLKRTQVQYDATYNKSSLTLPLDAFPTSPWHYDITQNHLLFNIVDFELLKVEISESPDTVKIGDTSIPTTKFDFTGEWKARLWFDKNKQFVKGEYDVSGRQVTVILDPK